AADGQIIWATLRQEYLRQAGATADMDDGLPSYLKDIEGVAIAVLFKEESNQMTRVSLRASDPFDAARIAAHFGGGGHLRAAGFSLARAGDTGASEGKPYPGAALRERRGPLLRHAPPRLGSGLLSATRQPLPLLPKRLPAL